MGSGAAHIGFVGKHPAFGDFIAAGVDAQWRAAFEGWLTPVLAQLRSLMGAQWEGFYDTARPLRFWLGGHVLNRGGSCRGVIMVSRDKVGRRYPFVLVQSDAPEAPPPLDPDQSFFEQAEAFAAGLIEMRPDSPDGLLATHTPERPQPARVESQLWAMNPSEDVQGLLRDTAIADHIRAAATRSYWWCAGQGGIASSVLAVEGLPDAGGFAWVLGGAGPEAMTPRTSEPAA